jgi:hypothetical protein
MPSPEPGARAENAAPDEAIGDFPPIAYHDPITGTDVMLTARAPTPVTSSAAHADPALANALREPNPWRVILLMFLHLGAITGALMAYLASQVVWLRWGAVATIGAASLVPILGRNSAAIRVLNQMGEHLHHHETGVWPSPSTDGALARQMVVAGVLHALWAFGFAVNLLAGWRVGMASTAALAFALVLARAIVRRRFRRSALQDSRNPTRDLPPRERQLP